MHTIGTRILVENKNKKKMPFTLDMDEDSYISTDDLSCVWVDLSWSLVGWNSPCIGVQVNLFQDSSEIISVTRLVMTSLVSETFCPLGDLLVSDPGNTVGIKMVVDKPHGSKVIYPDVVVSHLQGTLVVPPVVPGENFAPPPSGQSHTLPQWQ